MTAPIIICFSSQIIVDFDRTVIDYLGKRPVREPGKEEKDGFEMAWNLPDGW